MNEELETIVYNKEFVDNNFSESKLIKGIFTLGKDTKEAKECIYINKSKIYEIRLKINKYNITLEKNYKEMNILKSEFQERCWYEKKRYEN